MKKVRRNELFKAAIILALLLAMFEASADNKMYKQTPALFPIPHTVEYGNGQFSINQQTTVAYRQPELVAVVKQLQLMLSPALGFELIENDVFDAADIRIALDDSFAHDEAYELIVNESGINIKAATAKAAFYALQTLRQLLPEALETNKPQSIDWSLPFTAIKDFPRYQHRGMMLDVSRHFFSVDFVKRYIDLLAAHKMNVFHWHLTDDQGWRIEIEAYPKLTTVGAWREGTVVGHTSNKDPEYSNERYGGFYTQDQIREVVQYAADRYIEVIPEIDIPGHAAAMLAAYPEYACDKSTYKVQKDFGIFPDVLCPSEATFTLLTNIFSEVASLFPSSYIHIGGDEVKKERWQNCQHCQTLMQQQQLESYEQLQGYFVKRVEQIINQLGKKIIGWDEVLDGGVNTSTTIMSWRGLEGGTKAAQLGHDVIMTPVSAVYFDFYQSTSLTEPEAIHGLTTLQKTYAFEPTPDVLDTQQAAHILGAQGNVWTEYMPTEDKLEYMVLPRMTALAEVLWSPKSKRDWANFSARLPQLFSRYEAMGLNASKAVYAPSAEAKVIDNEKLAVTFNKFIDGVDIYYTLDGSVPNKSSSLYESPIIVTQDTVINATAYDQSTDSYYGHERLSLAVHKGIGKKASFYNAKGDELLADFDGDLILNGLLARDRIFQFHEWAAIDDKGLQLVLELGDKTEVSQLSLAYGTDHHRRLYKPSALSVYLNDGEDVWQQVAEITASQLAENNSVSIDFEPQQVRYVKVIIENTLQAYSTENRKQQIMPVYIDEVVIR